MVSTTRAYEKDTRVRLADYGLADAGPSPWEHRLGEAIPTREQMWHSQIAWAAEFGRRQCVVRLAGVSARAS